MLLELFKVFIEREKEVYRYWGYGKGDREGVGMVVVRKRIVRLG